MHMRELRQVIETKKPVKGEVPFTGASGISGVYEYIFNPVLGADGRVEMVIGTTRDVTDRAGLNAALTAERSKLAAVIEQAPAFMAVLRGPDHVFELANERYYTIVGRRDILGKAVREALPEVVDQGFIQLLDRVFQSGEPFAGSEMSVMLRRRNESDALERRYLNFIYQPIREADEHISGVFVHGVDVTEQVAARDALSQREGWLRAVLEATPECVKLVGPEGELLFMNPSGLGMIETEDEASVRGGCVFDLVAPEYREQWREMHRRVCAGERLTWDFEIVGLKGTRRHMESHAVPLPLPDGRMAQLAVTRDVSRRKEDERARAHLAAVVASSDDAIISKNLDGIIQSWNAGAQRVFGYTSEETVGRSILMLLPPERHHEEDIILSRLRAGQRIDHYESVRMTKDGRHIDVSLTISPMRDASGRIIAASKIARDVTQQKQAQRELQAAKELAERANREKDELLQSERAARTELERASRMKDEFLATLSHELRTPLNAIIGWSQLLAKSNLPPDQMEGIQIIERNARVQAGIIEDLLDMSRIISGKVRLDVQRLDLSTVVAAAVETVRPAADAKGVRLQSVLDPLAGPVSGDANRLQQVFWNLLTNAVKFTPRGGRVQVVLERVNSHLEVSVIDTGEGISAEFLPHVFDRFRQADAGTNRKHGGLGLGLAIVKQLVELHGGSVRVKSGGTGAGSTFTVALPVTVIHPEPEPETERRHPSLGGVPLGDDVCSRVEGIKVLVVDDEPDARTLVRRLLEECKAIVSSASTANEALALLKSERPQVLVSDIGMPGEDGYSLIRRVRSLPPNEGGNTPAIALTAYARAEDRLKAVLAGFQHHVVKPVEPAELITLVAILAGTTRSVG
jgi:PAS domain S-box-containing protein